MRRQAKLTKKTNQTAKEAADRRRAAIKRELIFLQTLKACVPEGGSCSISARGSCFVPETLVHGFEGWSPKLVQIGRMRTRKFVLTYGPGEAFERAAEVVRDWSRARLISMVLHKPGGGRVEMELLRDDGWLPSLPRVDGKYWLSMPEMGVEGACDLIGVAPCPPVPAGPGRMVTGTFRHTSGEVYDLQVAAETQPLGVTATHPFWSVDRHMWVSAIDLRIGETLRILTGTTQVVSMKKRPALETVCNIEVEGDHVYRVGGQGILVHNDSVSAASVDAPKCSPCDAARTEWPDGRLLSTVLSLHALFEGFWDRVYRTTAIAIVECGDKCHMVISVSGNNAIPSVLRAAETLGFDEYWSGADHAEANILDRAGAGCKVLYLAVCRVPCGPDRRDCAGRLAGVHVVHPGGDRCRTPES